MAALLRQWEKAGIAYGTSVRGQLQNERARLAPVGKGRGLIRPAGLPKPSIPCSALPPILLPAPTPRPHPGTPSPWPSAPTSASSTPRRLRWAARAGAPPARRPAAACHAVGPLPWGQKASHTEHALLRASSLVGMLRSSAGGARGSLACCSAPPPPDGVHRHCPTRSSASCRRRLATAG